MDHNEIRSFLENFEPRRERTIVIVDYGNVEKWKHSLHWRVGIKELAQLAKSFSIGKPIFVDFISDPITDLVKNLKFWSPFRD
jgi:hypothetical protein